MTYREFRKYLDELTQIQLDCDVAVHDLNLDEFYPVDAISLAEADDVLDEGHPILHFNAG